MTSATSGFGNGPAGPQDPNVPSDLNGLFRESDGADTSALHLAFEALRARQAEIDRLNAELEATNRGVLALYAELDDRAEDLKRVSEIKSRFLYDVGHELRTPLTSMINLTRLLLERMDGPLTEEQEQQVRLIHRSAQTVTELVNDLLDLAKIEAGQTTLRPTRFSVIELFGALRGLFRPLVTNPRVALLFDGATGGPPLYTDERRLSQVLRNLIANALKFTEVGEVRVSAVVGDRDSICFLVRDTGVGIAPEDQERIFEEFTQVDGPVQRRVQGTGLGLPLSRKLAGLLGGGIALSSTPGKGSTFSVVIPRELPASADGEPCSGDGSVRQDARWDPSSRRYTGGELRA